ncbi:MAG: PAS domain-containing sensor histidine kinase [Myxococcota bacterium]
MSFEPNPAATEYGSVLIDKLPDGVLIIDRAGTVREANQAFLRLIGRTRSEVVGVSVEDLIADQDVLRLLGSQSFLAEASAEESSIIFACGDGRPMPLLVSFARPEQDSTTVLVARAHGEVRNELQDASRWMAVEQERSQELRRARDALEAKNAALSATQIELEHAYAKLQDEVATRERLENELRLAQKLEAVGALAAGLAHEINTPMQYIGDNGSFLGSAIQQLATFAAAARDAYQHDFSIDQLRERVERAAADNDIDYLLEEAPRAVSALRDGVEQVSKIVRAMKSFARADQAEKLPADLNQAIRDTLLVAHGEYKHVLSVETELGELPHVTCVVSALNQVFLNLIVNAVHAVVDAQRGEAGKIRIRSRVPNDDPSVVEISICDNGCGIPEVIRHRVFDQFFTTKQVGRGSGQGLAIVRRIVVEGHGGSINFESRVGEGTTFVIRIPIEAGDTAQ